MNIANKEDVRHVGLMREWSCPTCSALMTGLDVPGPDERACADCKPVPVDAPSGCDIGACGNAELWTKRAVKAIEARDWKAAENAIENAAIFVGKALGR